MMGDSSRGLLQECWYKVDVCETVALELSVLETGISVFEYNNNARRIEDGGDSR